MSIKFEKLIDYNDSFYPKFYKDKIKGRYKVENGTTVVYSDWNETMIEGDISGINFWQGNYELTYLDKPECSLPYDVKIKLDPNNSNKLIWDMEGDGVVQPFASDCDKYFDPNLGAVTTLPLHMVLTRQ